MEDFKFLETIVESAVLQINMLDEFLNARIEQ
jgi:hypothetical protein